MRQRLPTQAGNRVTCHRTSCCYKTALDDVLQPNRLDIVRATVNWYCFDGQEQDFAFTEQVSRVRLRDRCDK